MNACLHVGVDEFAVEREANIHRLVQKSGQAKGGDPGWRFKIPKPPVSALARFGKAAYACAAET